jgi:SPP1 family predicted phage head-tail adaptor
MRAGALRHRVEIQIPFEDRDDIGGVRQIWMVVGEAWADIEPLTGKEVYEASSLEGRLSHRITLRGTTVLEPTWRLVWKDQTRAFQLYSIKDLGERHRTIQAMAMEILN